MMPQDGLVTALLLLVPMRDTDSVALQSHKGFTAPQAAGVHRGSEGLPGETT